MRRTRGLVLLGLVLLPASSLLAQSIPLKTIPIATGEQFLIFPSRNLGMGGLSVAYDDSLGQAFGNPAAGARVKGSWFAALPLTYGSSDGQVGGRTLPLALVLGSERWFGSFAVAMQQLDEPQQQWWWGGLPRESAELLQDGAASNSYLHGSLGRKLGDGRTSVAVSAYHAELQAIDGVGQLYGNSSSISQEGGITELRLGAQRELGGKRRVEAMLGTSTLDMTHDVVYMNWMFVQPNTPPQLVTRTEHNHDRTETWSGMVRYTLPLETEARLGLVLIGNTKSHPKLPNYDLVRIPRDPGNSAVFGIGAGVSARDGKSLYGAEVMLQPGRSHTWAFADTVTHTPTGVLRPGEKTVDNRFSFANWTMALGWQYAWGHNDVQLGLRVNQYAYRLKQHNYLAETDNDSRESWLEWSPGWGGGIRLGRSELRYSGRFVAKGFDPPGTTRAVDFMTPEAGGSDFLVAPTQPVWLPDFRVTLHRFMLVVPLSR